MHGVFRGGNFVEGIISAHDFVKLRSKDAAVHIRRDGAVLEVYTEACMFILHRRVLCFTSDVNNHVSLIWGAPLHIPYVNRRKHVRNLCTSKVKTAEEDANKILRGPHTSMTIDECIYSFLAMSTGGGLCVHNHSQGSASCPLCGLGHARRIL